MKLLSFAVPCYNSEAYMEKCIESLLAGGEEVEILIIDDGSKDRTAEIADSYAEKYPTIVKAIHKENGGHGSAVNTGIANATGLYFKVVDSDDWVKEEVYRQILAKLHELTGGETTLDMLISNFVYEKAGEKRRKVMRYRHALPVDQMFTWDDVHHFHKGQYILMHSVIFRTKLLRECGIQLPEHTFYVDNLFSYQPLPYAKNLYYMDIDLYHYYLGREDQSVNEKVLMKRIDQQIRVTELVAKSVDLREVKKMYPKLAVYMMRNISIMLSISSIHLLLIKTEEAFQKRKRMWEQVKDYDRILYYRLRCSTLSGLTYLPGRLGGKITVGGYRMARKIYQFQ